MVTEEEFEKALDIAVNTPVIPLENGGGVMLLDYIVNLSAQDAVDLGVFLTEKTQEGKPRFHWYSDIRADEWEDVQKEILRPLLKAAIDYLSDTEPKKGDS